MKTYDKVRCGTCGVPWEEHRDSCSRHGYRPGAELPSKTAGGIALWTDAKPMIIQKPHPNGAAMQ